MNKTPVNMPELARLSEMLENGPTPSERVAPAPVVVAPSARLNVPANQASAGAKRGPARPALPGQQPWGGQTLGLLFSRVNWTNKASYVPLAHRDDQGRLRKIRGELSLGAFFRLGNWTNETTAPEWPTEGEGEVPAAPVQTALPARSVDSVMGGFNWDE